MIYALWDMQSNNLVVEYPDEQSALRVVLESIDRHGIGAAESLALDVEDELGNIVPIAQGRKLVERARHELRSARLVG